MRKVLNFVIVVVTILASFTIQTSVLPYLKAGGVTANLMIVVTCAFSFLLGETPGLFLGLFAGLLSDLMFGPMFGFYGAVYALIGFLCGKFKRLLFVEGLGFPVVMVAVSDLVYSFLSYVFLFLIRNRLFLADFFVQLMLPEMIYTCVVTVPVFPVITWVYHKFMEPNHEVPANAGTS